MIIHLKNNKHLRGVNIEKIFRKYNKDSGTGRKKHIFNSAKVFINV